MRYDGKRALDLLRMGSGIPDAQFREGQEEAIKHVVEGRGNLLVVQKTGWGKSFVYFIATKLLREGGTGPSLLISPLLSLMRNQIAAAERMSVRAETINSANTDEWEDVRWKLQKDEIDILLITPEQLAKDYFLENVLPAMAGRIAMLVIDEAHCISDWGHDFRPDYRRIERIVRTLPRNVQVLGTTATANDRVLDDLSEVLSPNTKVTRGDLSRPSLFLQTIKLPNRAERMAWLADRLAEIPGSGIIYTLTIRDAERVARWLQHKGFNVQAYTARSQNREKLEQALLVNRVKALVATVALGMGYDKPDLTFVIHYQTPGSVVGYYQQVGRAGRGVEAAYGVLLSGAEDTDITDFFINSAFPAKQEVMQIIAALEEAPQGLSIPQILEAVNVRHMRLDQSIKMLALESPPPIVKQGPRWQLTAATLDDAFWERAERLTALRHKEQAEMQEYLALESGHMEFLIQALDGNPKGIQQPDLSPLSTSVGQDTVREAVEFLQRTSLPIEPRRQWSTRQAIPVQQRAEEGRALCVWGDAGWGHLVRSGKYEDNRFSNELVKASVDLVGEWKPQPLPAWVTCIPSLRHPTLVQDFAERVATKLGLPFRAALDKTEARPEQKTMANSAQQARNVIDSISVLPDQLIPAPVLLVDDIVDSRWTFTIAASLLRNNGCPAVLPFALADAGTG